MLNALWARVSLRAESIPPGHSRERSRQAVHGCRGLQTGAATHPEQLAKSTRCKQVAVNARCKRRIADGFFRTTI